MGNISSACSTDDSELAPPDAELSAGGAGLFFTSQRVASGTTVVASRELDPAAIGTAAALQGVLHAALENAADVLDVLCATVARGQRKAAVALLDRTAAAQAALSPAACELLIAVQPGRARAVLFKRLNAVRALRPAAATEADSAAIIALLEALEEFEKQSSEMASPGADGGDVEEQGPGQHGQEQEPAEIMAVRAELRYLSVGALRKQARAAGVDGDVLEDARDSDDPKTALVELLVQWRRDAGALADVLPTLQAGAEEADGVLGALERLPAVAGVAMPAELNLAPVGGRSAAVGDDAADRDPAIVALRLELGTLKVRELRKRASSEGVDGNAVEEAFDSDDAKAALVELLVQRRREVGALADVLPALEAGGEEAVVVVGGCLEHAMEVLDSLSASGGRRERKVVMELLDRVEVAAESVDLVWLGAVLSMRWRCWTRCRRQLGVESGRR